tara:strand:+ start:466 stop:963 length:498 start_codon:yes stop_codon:yes gene_type:complete
MWAVIKIDKKKFFSFKQDLNIKFGGGAEVYRPKLLINKIKKNKLYKKEFDLLGDYLFCYHTSFIQKGLMDQLKFTKGVKYLLNGSISSQKEIKKFIYKCKSLENKKGYLKQSFYDLEINEYYKFSSGPFTDKIFKIIELQKNKINILMGNIKTNISKKEFLFTPL